jgi:hypothetical protein
VITDISPTETPMLSRFGKSTAAGTTHIWLTDSLASAAANAQTEGAAVDAPALTARSRVTNNTQIFAKAYEVSSTQDAVDVAGVTSEFSYQAQKALKELARDIANILCLNTQYAGKSC